MRIAKITGLVLALALVFTFYAAAATPDIFSIKTALNATAARKNCGISMLSGEVFEFSARDLEMRLGLSDGALGGITVTALPKPEQGELVVDGARIGTFEFIDRAEVDRLCFVPNEGAVAANVTFIPRARNPVTTELSINILTAPDTPPKIQGGAYDTVRNIPVYGYVTLEGSEGGATEIRVTRPPVNGAVTFDGPKFRYTPYRNVYGKDSFVIYAVDAMNNYSNKAVITVNIEKPKRDFYYEDMANDPNAYAAVKLREKSIISGKQIGKSFFFFPDETVSRGEFLVMVISARGLERYLNPTVNTGLPNDASIPGWLKPYVKKSVDEGIWPPTQPFIHDRPPTRAEAIVLIDRASKISGVKDCPLQMSDAADIPGWALQSYKNLAAHKILELHDNFARPSDNLTNSFAAGLVWQLWKYCH